MLEHLVEDKKFDFWVIAKNSIGESGKSNVVSAITHFVPTAPTGVRAYAQGTGYARVSWNSVKGATSYEIWAENANENVRTRKKFLVTTSRGITEVVRMPSGGSYFFYVKAVNGTSTSDFSSHSGCVTIH